ncbi:MAG: hypothetical protein MJ105_00875 [Lachnospiraceae bacterium]|nr:hypothetical protein [Lachnospiraceae bacterium]
MKKIAKRILLIVACLSLAVGVFLGSRPEKAEAACAIVVRIPYDGYLLNHGQLVPESQLVSVGVVNGRIHQIAFMATGNAFFYKEYAIWDFEDFNQLTALDASYGALAMTNCRIGFIDYSGTNPQVAASVNGTVTAAAVAYHERVSGRMSDADFAKYFQQGSPAYNNAVASDSGRKWGAFYNNLAIKNAIVWDVYFYTPNDFVARATVSGGTYFADNYTIAMMFHKTGATYKVTNLTYMN